MKETLGDFLFGVVEQFGDRTALLSRPRYRMDTWTYHDLWRESGRVSCWMHEQGVNSGDRVILWAPNSPWWVATYFGLLRLGAIVVPLDIRSDSAFISLVVTQTDPRLAIVAADMQPQGLGDLRTVDIITMASTLGAADAYAPATMTPDSVAQIMFTSGTTGHPKGVILTHANILANVRSIAQVLPQRSNYRLLSLLPLSYMLEQTVGLLLPLQCGGQVYYSSSTQPQAIFRDLAQERITTIVAVPQLLALFMNAIEQEVYRKGQRLLWQGMQRLAEHLPMVARRVLFAGVHRQLGGHLSFLITGGAALDTKLAQRWELLGIPVLQGYSATEAAPCITSSTLRERKPGTVGRPIPGIEVRIATDGEVLVFGANITQGYWHDEEATAAAFIDGWYRTDDLGVLDSDSFLTLYGRKGNVIIMQDGQSVYPEDVEEALRHEHGVREAVVFDKPSAHGSHLEAVVLLDESAPATDTLISHVNARLAPQQRIHSMLCWVDDDFPRTHTHKVKRDAIIAAVGDTNASELAQPVAQEQHSHQDAHTPLITLVAHMTGTPAKQLNNATALGASIGLDSLGRVELLSAIESNLGVYLDESLISALTTIGDVERMLEEQEGTAQPSFPTWPLSAPASILRWLVQRPLFSFVRSVAPETTWGMENLDDLPGPFLFVANHTSHLDTPTVLRILPRRISSHIAVAAAADYFFRNALVGAAVSLTLNAFPFSRTGAVGPTLEHCSNLIDRGWSLLLYPEGTRSTTNQIAPFREGVGLLAIELGVPVIPIRIYGMHRVLPKGQRRAQQGDVTLWIGAPLHIAPGKSYKEATAQIEAAVHVLGTTRDNTRKVVAKHGRT